MDKAIIPYAPSRETIPLIRVNKLFVAWLKDLQGLSRFKHILNIPLVVYYPVDWFSVKNKRAK